MKVLEAMFAITHLRQYLQCTVILHWSSTELDGTWRAKLNNTLTNFTFSFYILVCHTLRLSVSKQWCQQTPKQMWLIGSVKSNCIGQMLKVFVRFALWGPSIGLKRTKPDDLPVTALTSNSHWKFIIMLLVPSSGLMSTSPAATRTEAAVTCCLLFWRLLDVTVTS